MATLRKDPISGRWVIVITEEPKTPDLVINNDGSKPLELIINEILELQILKAIGKEI